MTETQQKRICPSCGFISNTSDTVCPNDSTELQAMLEDPMIGKVVAKRYKIVGRLGRGGMSVVYKAHHQFMDRLVAIKMLRSELASDDDSLKRLQIESKAISALKHPNIVPVYDFGMLENDIPFLVMEYLEGEDLDRYIKTSAPIHYTEAIPKFISICDGLEHAHQNGIIHRDIKPSNIILITENDGEKVPVIVDFGIAKMVDLNGEDLNKLTATGQVFGSPLYMSPEQCSAKRPDARSDIYSVGCVMYLALTGQSPLKGNTPVDTMVKHIQASPKPFSEVLGANDIPTKVELCVFKALEKDPDHRFHTMQEFSDALKNCINSLSYNSYRPSVSPPGSAEQFQQSLESSVQPKPDIAKDLVSSEAHVENSNTPIEAQEDKEAEPGNVANDIKNSLPEPQVSPQTDALQGIDKAKSSSKLPLAKIGMIAIGILVLSGAIYLGYSLFNTTGGKSDTRKKLTDAEEVPIEVIRGSINTNGHLPLKEFEKVSLANFKNQHMVKENGWVLVKHDEPKLVDPSEQNHRRYKGVVYKVFFDYKNRSYEQVAKDAYLDLKRRTKRLKRMNLRSDTFDDILVGGYKKNRVKKQQIEYTLKNERTILTYVIYYKTENKLCALQLIPTVDFSGTYAQQEKANKITEKFADDIIAYGLEFTEVTNSSK